MDAADLLWVANPVPKERQRDIDARREVVLRQIRVLKLLRESMHFIFKPSNMIQREPRGRNHVRDSSTGNCSFTCDKYSTQ